ncbi:hypothetical protein [Chloroflexus sp.]|uniref:hypothetical protein n=1 Tax=Chloroflexus sp. TaxID=1904827 RepID=UPI00298EDC97|nr:hypothetical protein [Chloroflexus sp.]MDW8403077.1 hypothetical protein [Chloroflexus sp.]
MASSLIKRINLRVAAGSQARRLPGVTLPALWLAIITVVTLVAGYAVRPLVTVDIGDNRDGAFLVDFNGREIDAAGAYERFEWPAGSATATVPGGRKGVWLARIIARPEADPLILLRESAAAVNGVRLEMPRRSGTEMFVKIPAHIAAAPTLTFELVSPLVGGEAPPAGVPLAVELAPARTYRWSTDQSQIVFPRLGQGNWIVRLNAVVAHPDGSPVNARLSANGVELAQLPEQPQLRRIQLLIPAALMNGGDLNLTLQADPYRDPRPLGVLVAEVSVAPAATSMLVTITPPPAALGLALFIVLGMFTCLALLTTGIRQRWYLDATGWAAAGLTLAVIAAGWVLVVYRFPSGQMIDRLAALTLLSLIVTVVMRPLTRWLMRQTGAEVSPAFTAALLIVFLVGFWLKAIGMLYPYYVGIDVFWHMDKARRIIYDGALPLYYSVNSPLNETTMPVAEWGRNPPVIPYSPWFHILATSYAIFPWPMEITANFVSLLMDMSRVVLIAAIALKAGFSQRAALLAAVTYAVLPVTYLLHIWGNVPTAAGLWLNLLVQTTILLAWDRIGEWKVQLWFVPLLVLAFLVYTVTGVFTGVFLVVFTILIWLNARRGPEWRELLPGLQPLWVAAGAAIGLAIAIYYGQYFQPIVERTIPYLATVFTRGPETVGVSRPPFHEYLWSFVPHLGYHLWPNHYLYYGLAIPLIFFIPGYWAMRTKPLLWLVVSAWGTVALLFLLAGYRISMVDKQLFYLIPVICLAWAIMADRLWVRWPGRLFVLATLALSLGSALWLWVMRISISPVQGN